MPPYGEGVLAFKKEARASQGSVSLLTYIVSNHSAEKRTATLEFSHTPKFTNAIHINIFPLLYPMFPLGRAPRRMALAASYSCHRELLTDRSFKAVSALHRHCAYSTIPDQIIVLYPR